MKSVQERYTKYQTAYGQGRISQEQMDKVRTWAENRMAYAQQRYDKFQESTAGQFDSSVQGN